ARFSVYTELAGAALGDGDPGLALAALTKGLVFVQDRAAAEPNDLAWRKRLAILHQGMGKLHLTQSRVAEAEKEYRESTALWRGLASGPALRPGAQRELAFALRGLGDLEIEQLNTESALALYEECVSLLERLPAAVSSESSRLGDLGSSYDRRAQALPTLGRARCA